MNLPGRILRLHELEREWRALGVGHERLAESCETMARQLMTHWLSDVPAAPVGRRQREAGPPLVPAVAPIPPRAEWPSLVANFTASAATSGLRGRAFMRALAGFYLAYKAHLLMLTRDCLGTADSVGNNHNEKE